MFHEQVVQVTQHGIATLFVLQVDPHAVTVVACVLHLCQQLVQGFGSGVPCIVGHVEFAAVPDCIDLDACVPVFKAGRAALDRVFLDFPRRTEGLRASVGPQVRVTCS